jgi:hypothetical protein
MKVVHDSGRISKDCAGPAGGQLSVWSSTNALQVIARIKVVRDPDDIGGQPGANVLTIMGGQQPVSHKPRRYFWQSAVPRNTTRVGGRADVHKVAAQFNQPG